MTGNAGSGIRLPRQAPGQSTEQYLDLLVKQTELALQRLATRQGNPPVVTGSRGGNVALASLLTVLAKASVITDQTTP